MKVLVTGSRNGFIGVETVLDEMKDKLPITEMICGGAAGVDWQCEDWAENHGLPVHVFEANWLAEGLAAGPKRNQRMINEGKPEFAIIFPGGKGTADCARRIKESKIPYVEIK